MASHNAAEIGRGRGAAIHLGPSLFPVRVPRRLMTPLLMSPQKQNTNHHCPSHTPRYSCLVLYLPPTKSKGLSQDRFCHPISSKGYGRSSRSWRSGGTEWHVWEDYEKTCGFIAVNVLNKRLGEEVGVILTWYMKLRSIRRMCFNLT